MAAGLRHRIRPSHEKLTRMPTAAAGLSYWLKYNRTGFAMGSRMVKKIMQLIEPYGFYTLLLVLK